MLVEYDSDHFEDMVPRCLINPYSLNTVRNGAVTRPYRPSMGETAVSPEHVPRGVMTTRMRMCT